MNSIISILDELIKTYLSNEYKVEVNNLLFQFTKKEHEGDITLTLFPLLKILKKSPQVIGEEFTDLLIKTNIVSNVNLVSGFLNISLSDKAWHQVLTSAISDACTIEESEKENIVVEFCGPNTNKPLHIGHLRNIFLGMSTARILYEVGHNVKKVNIYNDRGIAICKSMTAYKLFGNDDNPSSSNMKPDHFVGKYYTLYNQKVQEEIESLKSEKSEKEYKEKDTNISKYNDKLLQKWELGDIDTITLWKTMNSWFYEGLQETLKRLHVDFDKEYYESSEYKKGKEIIEKGVQKDVFTINEDNSIFIDLSDKGLDTKVVQRGDGTSLYITQDIALVKSRYDDFKMNKMIYVVGDEQNYHFKVLKEIIEKLKEPFSSSIYHLSYGMITDPDGKKLKSREGTSTKADEEINEAVREAKIQTLKSGKAEEMTKEYVELLSEKTGIAAMRFAFLKISPTKSISYDPKSAIDMNGDTSTFVQYGYVRTHAILQKTGYETKSVEIEKYHKEEKDLILQLSQYQEVVKRSAKKYDPSEVTNYVLSLTRTFNRFYTQHSIIKAESSNTKESRKLLTIKTSQIIKKCLHLLAIEVPEKM